jgi:hypothetical protein
VAVTRPSAPESSSRVTVPKLNKDPIQSLCPHSVIIPVGMYEVEIPAMPAADWLSELMVPDLTLDNIFPGFLSEEDTDLVEEMIISGDLDIEEYEQIILSVIETASARDWWVTFRLIEMARTNWDVLGAELTLRGVDAGQVSLSSWLDVILILALRNTDPKDATMFTMRLEAPPPDTETEEPEMAASQFMSMA